MNDPLQNLITEKAFAEALGVSTATIRRYRREGLPYLRVGKRILLEVAASVDWIAKHCRQTGQTPTT